LVLVLDGVITVEFRRINFARFQEINEEEADTFEIIFLAHWSSKGLIQAGKLCKKVSMLEFLRLHVGMFLRLEW
jgi:hypothetical protein